MLKGLSYYVLLFTALSAVSCQNGADLIVHNASIYTMNDKMGKATAFVIKNGKFIDVGGEEVLKKYSANQLILHIKCLSNLIFFLKENSIQKEFMVDGHIIQNHPF